MLGPFSQPIFDHYCISPLGLTEKKVPGKYRLIEDLSTVLEGLSVNNAIPVEAGDVSYDTVNNVARMIQGYGQGLVLGKMDVEHVYTSIRNEMGEGGLVMGCHSPNGDQVRMCHLQGFFISSAVLGRQERVWTNESRTG